MCAPLNKLNIELSYDPAIPLLGIYPKELKAGARTDTGTPMFIAALFTMAKGWKQSKYSSLDEGKIKCGIYTQWNIIQP